MNHEYENQLLTNSLLCTGHLHDLLVPRKQCVNAITVTFFYTCLNVNDNIGGLRLAIDFTENC